MDQAMRLKKDRIRAYQEEDEEEDEEDEDWDDDEDDEDYDPKMEKITTILAIVAALLIGSIIIFLIGRAVGIFHFGSSDGKDTTQESTEQVEMIKVVGMNVDDAKKALLELGLTPEIKYEENTNYAEGTVLRASAQEGIMLPKDTVIQLTVAQSSEGITVPSVTGKSQAEAPSILEKEGFVVTVTQSYNASVQSGYVISQTPEAESSAPKGATITLTVSQGEENNKVSVPNVVGLEEMDAMASLTESGLTVGNVTQVTNEDASLQDKVCYQSYSVGTYVEKGTAVDIRISTGPAQVTDRYSEGITAPTEDAEYRSGMNVSVTVTTADGTQLLSTQTTSFPVAVNYTGIKSATGTITYVFNVETEATTTTDPETGETITTAATSKQKVVTREINFTQE